MVKKRNVIIMGAAGRDFHDFLTVFKYRKDHRVVCFTAEQIPGITGRKFPAALAGKRYPNGIAIYSEDKLEYLIKKHNVDEVIISYSDLSHTAVMNKASRVLAAGSNFRILSFHKTSLKSKKKVISVCAVRTGCGKSQVSRKIAQLLVKAKKKVVIVRHPMPYGNLVKQRVQRFATYEDLDYHNCTIEEREEYEPHLKLGIVVYAGVDYAAILKQAEKEADIIIWDGGNNDVSFFKSDLHIVVVDPHRAGHETRYHPGEENFLLADVIIINKMDSAQKKDVQKLLLSIKKLVKKPLVIKANSKVIIDKPILVKNKKALVVEDGPTLTHGGMAFGAGEVAAKRYNAKLVDPLPYAVGSIKKVYHKYSHLNSILPAMGYNKKQVRELQQTINKTPCHAVIDATPVNLQKLMKINKPWVLVDYELDEIGRPNLRTVLKRYKFL